MTIVELIPTAITDITVTLTEPASVDPEVWSSVTSYTSGQYSAYSDKKYIALQDSTNKQPDTEPTYWQYIGNVNKYAMIDEYINTQTLATGDIVIQFNTAGERAIHLANIYAESVQVVQVNNSITVLDETYTTVESVGDWYQYFFNPIEYRSDLFIPLGMYHTSTVTITIKNSAGAKIGGMFKGIPHSVAMSMWDSDVGILDYSKRLTDDYGNVYLNEGYWRKKMNISYAVATNKIDFLIKTVTKIRGKSAVFVASDKYDSLIAYGFVSDLSQTYNNPSMSFGQIQIEGLR